MHRASSEANADPRRRARRLATDRSAHAAGVVELRSLDENVVLGTLQLVVSKGRVAVGLLLASFAIGCADAIQAPIADQTSSRSPAVVERQAELERLADGLARALAKSPLREQLRDDLRGSRLTREHKLILGDYLRGNEGFLKGAAEALAVTPAALQAKVAQLPHLELYIPVRAHREMWTSDQPLLVATQLIEEDDPIAFSSSGERVALSKKAPPSAPVLALVPAESYGAPLLSESLSNSQELGRVGTWNTRGFGQQKSGAAAATLGSGVAPMNEDPCDPEIYEECDPGPTGPPPVTYPSGLYLDQASLTNLGESWVRGDPEIEVFVIGPTYYSTSQGENLSCAGENSAGPKWFDQDAGSWQSPYWAVQGLLLSEAEADSVEQIYNANATIQVWEDDQSSCEINTSERSDLELLAGNLQSAYRATSLLIQIITSNIRITPAAALGFRNAAVAAAYSPDDFLGLAVHTSTSSGVYSWFETSTLDLATPNGSNGTIVLRTIY